MSYLNLIKNWHTKASQDDYFSRFVFEYLAFIAYVRQICHVGLRTERAALQKLKQDELIKNYYLQEIQSNQTTKEAWQRIRAELNDSSLGNTSMATGNVEGIKWWNCSTDNIPQDRVVQETGVIHNECDWENMVEFWSAIRNNLFHGTKNPEDPRGQILIKSGFITLSALVSIFLTCNMNNRNDQNNTIRSSNIG